MSSDVEYNPENSVAFKNKDYGFFNLQKLYAIINPCSLPGVNILISTSDKYKMHQKI